MSVVNHRGRLRHRFFYWCQQNIFRNFLSNSDHCPFLTSKFSWKIQKRKKGELWIETCDSKSLLTLTNLTSTVRLIRESRIHNNRRFLTLQILKNFSWQVLNPVFWSYSNWREVEGLSIFISTRDPLRVLGRVLPFGPKGIHWFRYISIRIPSRDSRRWNWKFRENFFYSRIQNFCYIQVIVFDLSYLPVTAVGT